MDKPMITAELFLFDSHLLVVSDVPAALDYAAAHLPSWAHDPERVSDTTFVAALCVVDVPSVGDIEYWRAWIERETGEKSHSDMVR
jgi:hypothetical protein